MIVVLRSLNMDKDDFNTMFSSILAINHVKKKPKKNVEVLRNTQMRELAKRIIKLFKSRCTTTLEEIYSELEDLPLSDVVESWADYKMDSSAREIRKVLYFLEEHKVLRKSTFVRNNHYVNQWNYTPNRIEREIMKL
jgi:hypothetical protein